MNLTFVIHPSILSVYNVLNDFQQVAGACQMPEIADQESTVEDAHACAQTCLAVSTCVSFTWAPKEQLNCFLKSGMCHNAIIETNVTTYFKESKSTLGKVYS